MKSMKIDRFLKKYDRNLPLYEEMILTLKENFDSEIQKENHRLQSAEFRIKTKESLVKKIHDKGRKYVRLSDITDIIGVRVITFMEDQVDEIAEKIKNTFVVDEKNTIDKRKTLDPRSFGYLSLHYVVSFPDIEKYKKFKGVRFEVQIRSLLQHTWATIEHDLGYKSRVGIPDELIRSFSRVASLLELADKEFVSIKNELSKYEKDLHNTIKMGANMPGNTQLNNVTIKYFIEQNKVLNSLFQEIIEKLGVVQEKRDESYTEIIKLLKHFKIKKIGELESILEEKKQYIIFVTGKIIEEVGDKTMEKRGVFYSLAYVLLGEKPLSEKFKFLDLFKILTEEEKKVMAETMEKYHLEYQNKTKPRFKYSLKNIRLKRRES